MSITKVRKRLQDKLRSRFKWKTNSVANRYTSLIKPEAERHILGGREEKYIIELSVNIMDPWIKKQLLDDKWSLGDMMIRLTRKDLLEDGTFKPSGSMFVHLTFEELELIYKIAKEKEQEVCANIIGIK